MYRARHACGARADAHGSLSYSRHLVTEDLVIHIRQPTPAPIASSYQIARLLAWLGIVLGVVYLTIGSGGATPGVTLIPYRIISLVLITIALVAWLAVAWRFPSWRPRSALWPALAAALTAFAISTITSWNPRLSMEYVAYAIICTALYLLLVRLLADPFFRPRLGALAVLLCVSIGVLYVAVVLGLWVSWWSAVGRITTPPLRPSGEALTLGNPSAVATMMLLLCPVALAHLGAGSARRRALDVALLVLTAAVLLLTGSRGAWLGAGIGLAAFAAAVLVLPESRGAVRRALSRRVVRYGAAAGVVGILAAALALLPALASRLTDTGADSRLGFYLAAIRMFLASPILGSGPGTWAPRRVDFTSASSIDLYIPHAHNIYLQTLAEFGVLGVLAGLFAVACVVRLVLGAIRDRDAARRRYAWAAVFAVPYLAAHQLVDFYPNQPAVLFALALILGYLDATDRSGGIRLDRPSHTLVDRAQALVGARAPLGRLVMLALPLATVGALAFSSWSESVALTQARAVDAADNGSWSAALDLAQHAAASDPAMPPNQFMLGLADAATGRTASARDAFERVATADGFPEAWLNVAALDLRLGDVAAAREALDQSMRLGYQQASVAVPAAGLYLALGDTGAATAAVADALVVAPDLAGDPYWASTPGLEAAWRAALPTAIGTKDPSAGYRVALFAGRVSDAERVAASLDPASARTAGLFIRAWLGDRAALDALAAFVVGHPLDSTAAGLTAAAAAHQGDLQLAEHEQEISLQGATAMVPAGRIVRIGARCDLCQVVPGANASLYGLYAYRRPLPADLLVPDLPRLAYVPDPGP
jgi:O-antigen ligase